MKTYTFHLLLLLSVLSSNLFSEDVLKVRPKDKTLPRSRISDEELQLPSLFRLTSIQVSILTPLGQEIFPEKRFRAWGNAVTVSFPVQNFNENAHLHAELGAGATLIKLILTQPAVDFSHAFIFFPVRARFIYEFNKKLFGEAFLGTVIRLWEYDSREAPDGGFHKTTADTFAIDAGLGLGTFLNDNIFGRINFGIQFLSLSFGILL